MKLKRIALIFILLNLCLSLDIFGQRRPLLRTARRDHFAGKFLLIPPDERPSSLQQPRMIAEVADHDLVIPPARSLGDVHQIIGWARTVDYHEIDGAIISLKIFSGNAADARDGMRLIRWIRAQHPGIPIYGFTTTAATSNQILRSMIELIADGSLDSLLISSSDPQQETMQATINNEIVLRKLGNRISFDEDPDSAPTLLLVKMLNHRFGLFPRILPVFSSGAGRDVVQSGSSLRVHQLISNRIKAMGAIELQNTVDRNVDLLLFVHTPQTREQDRVALAESIAQTIDKNVRIGLVDLSETKESREAMMGELRRHKLADKMAAYSSLDPQTERPTHALTRVLGHASSFLLSLRFLRDDHDRVGRFDRAHVSLLLSSYLRDWAFALQVRPKLLSPASEKGDSPGAASKFDEASALQELKPLAEELFNEQFKHNVHAYLLPTGERAQYEVRMIQRLMLRLTTAPHAQRTIEVEIRPSMYLVHLGNAPVPQLQTNTSWQIHTADLDDRIERRWDAAIWPNFKTDVTTVELTFKISAKPGQQPSSDAPSHEGYSIRSKRSRESRRIEIIASSPQGAFNALGKLELMGGDGQLAQDFQITETPMMAHRGMIESFTGPQLSHRDRIEILRLLGRLRMNRFYYAARRDESPFDEQSGRGAERLKELIQAAEENFVQFVYAIDLRPASSYSNEEIVGITKKFDGLVALGVRRFAICFDDPPEETESAESNDNLQRLKSVANAQAQLISALRDRLKRSGDVELLARPGLHDGSGSGREYLKEFSAAIPQDVQLIVEQENHGIKSAELPALTNSRPVIHNYFGGDTDASWRICLIPKRSEGSGLSERGIGLIASPMNQIWASVPQLAALAEYAWDPRGHDPERAFNRALNLFYDERTRKGMRVWSQILSDCRNAEKLFDPLFSHGRKEVVPGQVDAGQINAEMIEQRLGELWSALEMIGGTRERGLLRGELSQFIFRAVSALESSGAKKR